MKQAADGVIESYHDDLNVHDLAFLNRMNTTKSLVEQQSENEERIFWSVGDCGTHIGMMHEASQRVWMQIDSYAKYNHYQVWFSVTVDDVITVQLIKVD
jgi:hypothetical protein